GHPFILAHAARCLGGWPGISPEPSQVWPVTALRGITITYRDQIWPGCQPESCGSNHRELAAWCPEIPRRSAERPERIPATPRSAEDRGVPMEANGSTVRVTVVRSEGFSGIERRAESDSASDPMLTRLVDRVDLTAVPPPGRIPDQFLY